MPRSYEYFHINLVKFRDVIARDPLRHLMSAIRSIFHNLRMILDYLRLDVHSSSIKLVRGATTSALHPISISLSMRESSRHTHILGQITRPMQYRHVFEILRWPIRVVCP